MPPAIEAEPLDDEMVEVVNANLGLVRKIADESRERRIDADDRFQAGCLGLIRAVQRFDPSKGVWSVYAATWIKQAISRAAAKAPRLASIDVVAEEGGFDPVDDPRGPTIDPVDADRLRALVSSLPDVHRSALIGRFYSRTKRRGRRRPMNETEAVAVHALRLATRCGEDVPGVIPRWVDRSDPHRPTRASEPDADDALALNDDLRHLRLLPRYPVNSLSTLSECPHKGPAPPPGSHDYCEICGKSGRDGMEIPIDVAPLPRDKPAVEKAPEPKPKLNRKARRKLARAV